MESSPLVKFEGSPAESFMSLEDDYPSLFSASTPSVTGSNMHALEIMTPQSYAAEANSDVPAMSISATTPGSEKKPTKKRKSWGQVLPEPKTNLPPRKRAKTEDEKEQRRVERVLRNRRAAQSSRERKRLEVEALEKRNKELEECLRSVQKTNLLLVEQLNKLQRNAGVVARSSSPTEALRDNTVTLSQELFSSQDSHADNENATVNPASLSPELGPVSDSNAPEGIEGEMADVPSQSPATKNSDLTQRPAAMLCDLQCHLSEGMSPATTTSTPQQSRSLLPQLTPHMILFLQLNMLQLASTVFTICQRPLTQIATSLKARTSIHPTPSILRTIIWLVTQVPSRRTSTSTNSSTKISHTSPRRPRLEQPSQRAKKPASVSTTLRVRILRKILTCSPNLARPLMDATMEALRLVSEGSGNRVERLQADSSATRDDSSGHGPSWADGTALPSREALVTLLWALKVEDRRIKRRERDANYVVLKPGYRSPVPTQNYIFEKTKHGANATC